MKKSNRSQQNKNQKQGVNPRTGNRATNISLSNRQKIEEAPVAIAHSQIMTEPKLTYTSDGGCRVRHREYFADFVSGSGGFNITAYVLNPGDETTFPWLHQIARRYESYLFNAVRVHYETQAPTTVAGTVMIGIDYDSNDIAPSSKVQLMAFHNSVRSAPWQDCLHISNLKDLRKRKTYYVSAGQRNADEDSGVDYDTGIIYAASQGFDDATTQGELYIEYDVSLMTPQLNSTDVQSLRIQNDSSSDSPTLPFGNNPVINGELNLTYTVNNGIGTFRFKNAWEGLMIFSDPTDFGTLSFPNATIPPPQLLQVAGTGPKIAIYRVIAERNQTFTVQMTGSPTTFVLRMAEYRYDLV